METTYKKKPGRPKKVIEPKRNAMGRIIEEPILSEKPYQALLEMGGVEYVGKGDSLIEALADMDKPQKYIARGVLVMRHGDKKTMTVLHPMIIRKVLEKSLFRTLWAKMYVSALA